MPAALPSLGAASRSWPKSRSAFGDVLGQGARILKGWEVSQGSATPPPLPLALFADCMSALGMLSPNFAVKKQMMFPYFHIRTQIGVH